MSTIFASIFKRWSSNIMSGKKPPRYKKEIGPVGWGLLIVPTATFCLGTWQVQRKAWKENLIQQMKDITTSKPQPLPDNLVDVEKMEYYPIHVRGTFLHDKEMYLGPRTLLSEGDAATSSALISSNQHKTNGYLIVTPLQLEDRDDIILVNRGWVPANLKDPKKRPNGQIEGVVDVVGVVRLHENRPTFMPAHKSRMEICLYRDLNFMCNQSGASRVYLDATKDFAVDAGPIPGQTRVTLRNEHLQYILTWYSLSAVTSFMWFKHFIAR